VGLAERALALQVESNIEESVNLFLGPFLRGNQVTTA